MQDEPLETVEQDGFTLKLYQDTDPQSPEEYENPENGAFIVTTKNRYFQTIPEGYDVQAIGDYLKTHKLYHNHEVFPLYAYIHSGVALSLGRLGQFADPWDSGQIGWALVRRDAVPKDKRYKAAEGVVETWNQYLSGDVYGYVIEEDGEHLDSCWGFYGRDYAMTEAKEALAYQAEKRKKDDARLAEECAL